LHLDGVVCKVAEGRIAVQRATVCSQVCPIVCAAHEPADLILQRVVLLLQLVVLLLDPQVVLNLLRLVVVTDLHLVAAHLLQLLLQALLLISERLERQHDLLDLILALLQHLLLLAVFTVEAFALTSALLLVAARILNLTVLDLDELAEILIFLPQRLVFLRDGLFFLLGLGNAGLVLLLLLAELGDLALQVGHELVLLADHG